MHNEDEYLAQLAHLQRALKHHPDAEVKNIERLDRLRNAHTAALCRSVRELLPYLSAPLFLGVTAIPPRRVSRFQGKGSMC